MSNEHEPPILYVVNHDAMYWRERALEAERRCVDLEQRLSESINTAMELADTSSRNLLTAIVAGAFDTKAPT